MLNYTAIIFIIGMIFVVISAFFVGITLGLATTGALLMLASYVDFKEQNRKE